MDLNTLAGGSSPRSETEALTQQLSVSGREAKQQDSAEEGAALEVGRSAPLHYHATTMGFVDTWLWQRSCSELLLPSRLFLQQDATAVRHQASSCPQPEHSAWLGQEDVKSYYAPETAVHRIRPGFKSGQQRS